MRPRIKPRESIQTLACIIALVGNFVLAEDRRDIEYGQAGGESLRLDAHVPDGSGPFPMVLIVHGGGWSSGDKQQGMAPIFEPLNKAGKFTWFSINYRLAPTNHWPACFEDAQTAIRWVKAHAREYKGDPRRLALLGYSAGGQLACLAAVQPKQDTEVQAVVGFAPPTDMVADTERRGGLSKSLQMLFGRETVDDPVRTLLQEMSAINFVRPGLPPFLLIHGTEDQSVPYAQSIHFQAKLKEAGVPCELVTINGAPHRLSEWEKFDASYREKMVTWLEQALGKKTVKIVLVGDSTVNDGQGWGTGFKKLLKPDVECVNWAKNGRSSKSFINEGWWEKALTEKPDYILIQFGHNDMPGKGPDRETDPATTYLEWMARYVDEARTAGAKPILVTSMTRRHFTSEGKIDSDLIPYVEAVKKLAAEKNVPLIDLHERSIEVLNQLGPKASEEFDPPSTTKPDKTHLAPKGIDVMGRLVAEDLKKVEPELASSIQ